MNEEISEDWISGEQCMEMLNWKTTLSIGAFLLAFNVTRQEKKGKRTPKSRSYWKASQVKKIVKLAKAFEKEQEERSA